MGGKNDSPDYGDLAVQQGEVNEDVVRDQTYANRPTQYTPWGFTDWQANSFTDPASQKEVTQWEQTQGLTPELQDLLNKQIAIQGGRTDIAGMLTGRLGGEFGQAMDWRGMNPMGQVPTSQFTLPENNLRNLNYNDAPGIDATDYGQLPGVNSPNGYQNAPGINYQGYGNNQGIGYGGYGGINGVGDPTALRQRAEDNVYNQARSRLDPQFQGKQQEMEIKLRNQGLGPEDAAWQSQMQGLGQQETDAYAQAQMNAINQGMGEQSQLFNQGMGLRNMATGEVNQDLQNRMGIRGMQNQEQNQNLQNQMGIRNMATGESDRQFGQEMGYRDMARGEVNQNFQNQMNLRNMATGEADKQSQFYNQAGQQAFDQAYGANQANFGQAMQGSQYANQIRQQQMTEAMQKRGFSLNEINALLSGQQVNAPQMPNFATAGAAQPAPVYEAGVAQGNYDASQNPINGLMGLGGSLGGAALGNTSLFK